MGLFSKPAKPEPPKPAPPAPTVDTKALESRNKAEGIKNRFGLADTALSLGRPRTPGASTLLGRQGTSNPASGYSQAA